MKRGEMTELLTAAQMREIEQAAMASGAVSGLTLMERAGQGVLRAIFAQWPELDTSVDKSRRAVVLCGPGNNGGDGFVVARLLRARGWVVQVYFYGAAERLPPDALRNFERWREVGPVEALTPERWVPEAALAQADLVVDALFGIGLTRPILLPLDQMGTQARCVAIDLPSGLCSDSGRVLGAPGDVFNADLTVSFHALKRGHMLAQGADFCGKVMVEPIGLSMDQGARVELVQPVDLEKRVQDHKFGHGHALILSGGIGKSGAARLAGRGALRIGAGLVTLGAPGSALMEVAAHITALMLTRVEGAEGLSSVLADQRINALCLGPGLGHARARALVPVALAAQRGTVLDADVLSCFADAPEALFAQLHEACVLTPHGGEFARLFPDIAARLQQPPAQGPAYSKIDATQEAAARAGCVVLYKGADTVIAAPDGRCCVHGAFYERAAPWLATAGSGDVLAGFITGLLARGIAPFEAAQTASWMHVSCARAFGPGLIAEDLPEQVPQVLNYR